jgi:HEAT repeat protein
VPAAELYPPLQGDGPPPRWEQARRWRLKLALIVALGRLRDAQAVPLLQRILADGRDFYTVYSVAVQAIGRIGDARGLPALGIALTEQEVNTRSRAAFAWKAITGREPEG